MSGRGSGCNFNPPGTFAPTEGSKFCAALAGLSAKLTSVSCELTARAIFSRCACDSWRRGRRLLRNCWGDVLRDRSGSSGAALLGCGGDGHDQTQNSGTIEKTLHMLLHQCASPVVAVSLSRLSLRLVWSSAAASAMASASALARQPWPQSFM